MCVCALRNCLQLCCSSEFQVVNTHALPLPDPHALLHSFTHSHSPQLKACLNHSFSKDAGSVFIIFFFQKSLQPLGSHLEVLAAIIIITMFMIINIFLVLLFNYVVVSAQVTIYTTWYKYYSSQYRDDLA